MKSEKELNKVLPDGAFKDRIVGKSNMRWSSNRTISQYLTFDGAPVQLQWQGHHYHNASDEYKV